MYEQPNLRQHVKLAFERAAKCLTAIDSPLTELRALYHTELAKLQVEDDAARVLHVTFTCYYLLFVEYSFACVNVLLLPN